MFRLAILLLAPLVAAGCTIAIQPPSSTPSPKSTSGTTTKTPTSPKPGVTKRGFLADKPLFQRSTVSHCARSSQNTGPFSPCSTETVVQLDGTYTYRSGNDPIATGTVPPAELAALKAALEDLDVAAVLRKEREGCKVMDATQSYVFNAQGQLITLQACVLDREPAAEALGAAVSRMLAVRTAPPPPAAEGQSSATAQVTLESGN